MSTNKSRTATKKPAPKAKDLKPKKDAKGGRKSGGTPVEY